MRRVHAEATWPESWKLSYAYDLEEVYGEATHRGYANAYRERRRHTLNLVTEALAPGSQILDIAAAQGNFSIALAEMGYRVTWNDLRAELADYVRMKHERGDLVFAPGNAFELTFDRPLRPESTSAAVWHDEDGAPLTTDIAIDGNDARRRESTVAEATRRRNRECDENDVRREGGAANAPA